MAYNFKPKRHVNWPRASCCQTLHQDSSNVGVLLCVKAKYVLRSSCDPAPPPPASCLRGARSRAWIEVALVSGVLCRVAVWQMS